MIRRWATTAACGLLLAGPAAADVRFTFSGTMEGAPRGGTPIRDGLIGELDAGADPRWTASFLLDDAQSVEFTPLEATFTFAGRTFDGTATSRVLADRHLQVWQMRAPIDLDVPGTEFIYFNLFLSFAEVEGIYPHVDPDFYLNVPPLYAGLDGSAAQITVNNSPSGQSITFMTRDIRAPYRNAIDSATIEGAFPPAPVPEPATWAMLLLGFSGLGAVVRRRRVAHA
jgi:hypothetical protein